MLSPYRLYTLWHPFSRSYGVILPSSLTKVLPRVLEFSSRLPVSVCGTGGNLLDSIFSWQCGIGRFVTCFSLPITSRHIRKRIYLLSLSTRLDAQSLTRSTYPPASTRLSNAFPQYRNVYLLSIDYAFRPRLRSRLTLRGRALLRKPWAFDG